MQANTVHMSCSHWFRGHMATYIRPVTVPVKKSHRNNATSQTHFQLSLSTQLDQNHKDSEKIEENSQTLKFSELNSGQIHGNGVSSQRFNGESSSLSYFLCNSSTELITESNEPNAITEKKFEKKRERNSKVLNRRRRRRRITGLFPDFKQESAETESNQSILKIQNQISE